VMSAGRLRQLTCKTSHGQFGNSFTKEILGRANSAVNL
jgi:hypothetical protein